MSTLGIEPESHHTIILSLQTFVTQVGLGHLKMGEFLIRCAPKLLGSNFIKVPNLCHSQEPITEFALQLCDISGGNSHTCIEN